MGGNVENTSTMVTMMMIMMMMTMMVIAYAITVARDSQVANTKPQVLPHTIALLKY